MLIEDPGGSDSDTLLPNSVLCKAGRRGPMGFRGPLGDSIPTASPFSLSAPSVLTSLHHWPSSFGKLPRSASLTIRKCSKTGLFWLSFHSHLNIWRRTQTEYQQQWYLHNAFQTHCKNPRTACSNRCKQYVSFKQMQKPPSPLAWVWSIKHSMRTGNRSAKLVFENPQTLFLHQIYTDHTRERTE